MAEKANADIFKFPHPTRTNEQHALNAGHDLLPFVKQQLRAAGLDANITPTFRKDKTGRNIAQTAHLTGSDPSSLNVARALIEAVNSIRFSDQANMAGTQANVQNALNKFQSVLQSEGVQASPFKSLFQGASDFGGVSTVIESEDGPAIFKPIEIGRETAEKETQKLIEETTGGALPPLTDLVGQPGQPAVPGQPPQVPGQPPLTPTDTGGLPPIQPGVGQPVVGQPLTPQPIDQALAQPAVGQPATPAVAQPRQVTIAIPDPRRPGELIEIPVVDRDLPAGLTADDITGQFDIELEALRQQEQNRQLFEQQRALRAQGLTELEGLLGRASERAFAENVPGLQEQLQGQGLLRSSELGEALGRERSRLAQLQQERIGEQSLANLAAEEAGLSGILGQRQQLQTAALQREQSLADFEREAELSKQLAQLGVANTRGVSSNPLGGILGGAATGALAGGAAGGIGAIPGALLGAVGGAGSSK